MDLQNALRKFGFTNQEALLYLTLLKSGGLTGYEAAKRAGVSRANAYAGLAALVDKGRAAKTGDGAARFVALSKEELLLNLAREFETARDFLEKNLPERIEEDAPYITISGFKPSVDKMTNMILSAGARIYASMESETAALIWDALERAAKKGLRVVIVSDRDPEINGAEYYAHEKEPGHIKIIVDTREMVTGTVFPEGSGHCLYSMNPHLVNLMREAFLNEIELIRFRKKDMNGEIN